MVESFEPQLASEIEAPRANPLSYPGSRPSTSYVLAEGYYWPVYKQNPKGEIESLHDTHVFSVKGEQGVNLDKFLKMKGATGLDDRYPIIAYGSNLLPSQLLSKLGKTAVVPVILATMRDVDVYYNLISNFGYAYAELADSGNNTSTKCRLGVTFLDRNQLRLMVETEQNYKLSMSPKSVEFDLGSTIGGGPDGSVFVFAGMRNIWVPQSYSGPVPIAEIPTVGRTRIALTQIQFLELAIKEFKLEKIGINTAEDLSNRILAETDLQEVKGKLKYDIQLKIKNDSRAIPPWSETLHSFSGDELPTNTYKFSKK